VTAARIGVVVAGVRGRMGQLIAHAAHKDARARVAGATVRPGSFGADEDIGAHIGAGHIGAAIAIDLDQAIARAPDGPTVVVDFTTPAALGAHLAACRRHKVAILIGTTGLGAETASVLDAAAAEIPVLVAANTSLGANLLVELSRLTTRALPDADVEIVEAHHKMKKDAPSGTALAIAKAIAHERDRSPDDVLVRGRAGHAPRTDGEIGVHAVRGGSVVGEHTVTFFLGHERVELVHKAQDRTLFAEGAIAAAVFLATQKPGRYTMADVLGLGR
jgi:4-hydroxy-tetrahydrodipicolinate reductase